MRFNKYLTPEERIEAWNTGITYKLAEKEILPSEFNQMCKQAEGFDAPAPLRALLWTAILTGAPIGIAAHLIHNEVKKTDTKNRALRRERDYLRDLSEELNQRLSQPATV